jgi:hypothetical protein
VPFPTCCLAAHQAPFQMSPFLMNSTASC